MAQALYAHMNNKKIKNLKKNLKNFSVAWMLWWIWSYRKEKN
jgi:hypothetical protein